MTYGGNEYLSSVICRWKDADEQGRRLLLLEQRRDSDNNLNILTLMDSACSLQATHFLKWRRAKSALQPLRKNFFPRM